MTRARLSATVTGVVAVAVLVACGASQAEPDPTGEDTAPEQTESGKGKAGGSAAPNPPDPAFAEDPPGKRTEALRSADMLISAEDEIDAELIDRIRDLDGVTAVAPISLINVPVEDKVYNVAAVDPAEYRLFTGQESADLQEQWDRVAGGEMAVSDELQQDLPVDGKGYLTMQGDNSIPVGAYAPQVRQIDMVINRTRGEALGISEINALVVSTGQASPQAMRKPIQQLIDGTASIQNLDAVAQYGLDPNAFQQAVFVGTFAEAVGVFNYTPIGGGRIAPDPAWVTAHIATETVPILGSVTCNKAIFPQLRAALSEIVTQGLADEINPKEYAGCYYPRFIAGTTKLSNHSFGLALDLNVPGNQRGTVGEMDRQVVAIFKYWGFGWGGDWNYTDPMHFELAQIKRPGG